MILLCTVCTVLSATYRETLDSFSSIVAYFHRPFDLPTAIRGPYLATRVVTRPSQCARACMDTPGCVAFNVETTFQDGTVIKQCELSPRRFDTSALTPSVRTGYVYYQEVSHNKILATILRKYGKSTLYFSILVFIV